MNRTLHGCLEIQNFSSCVEKYFTRSRIFQHLKRNFISLDSNVVSSRSIKLMIFIAFDMEMRLILFVCMFLNKIIFGCRFNCNNYWDSSLN